MKLKRSTIILIIGVVIGLSLLLYPTVSNYWNSKHATRAIAGYVASMEQMDEDQYEDIWLSAIDYNAELAASGKKFELTPELRARYAAELNAASNGVMGYIEIKKLDVSLPVYHGTSEGVLQIAVGHLDWSSLPTGGDSTHCVVSGHRGLPSAKLFTDLDALREGDTFEFIVLGETLTYEVDQIRTVLPNDIADLAIVPGKDYCTLVTCTPYGINSHRLLVRGHRVPNTVDAARVVSDAVLIDPLIVAPVVALPLLILLFLAVMLKKPEKKADQSV